MQNDRKEVKMYSDFKSPYAFLAFDPAFALETKYRVTIKWKPFQLRLKGKGERSQYSEYKVKYSYMDARRWANMRGGLMIRGPLKIFDTTPALIGGLYAEKHGKLREYGNELRGQLVAFIAAIGVSRASSINVAFKFLLKRVSAELRFFFEQEPFWGYDRMGLLEHRLTEAGLKLEQPLKQAV